MAGVNRTTAGIVAAVNGSLTTMVTVLDTTTEEDIGAYYKKLKIISSLVVGGSLLLVFGISCLIYKRICRSHRSRRHGIEMEQMLANMKGLQQTGKAKPKREYFDQFGVDTHELTVNSVTAILSDDDVKKLYQGTGGSKSSGIECDFSVSDEGRDSVPPPVVRKINTGKRVFQVNKVADNGTAPSVSANQMVIRLHKGFADAARSLQASDGKNYMLAVIDKNSQTIHNVDLRNYRPRTRGRSPLAGDGRPSPQRVGYPGKRRRLLSAGDTALGPPLASLVSPSGNMVHDSPDAVRRTISTNGVVECSSESLTDQSYTTSSDREKRRRSTSSLSSKEADEPIVDSAAVKLLPKKYIDDSD